MIGLPLEHIKLHAYQTHQIPSHNTQLPFVFSRHCHRHSRANRPEERGVERGSARRPSLKERERAIVNQTNIGTVSKAMLGKLLRDGLERIWVFLNA